MSKPSHDEQVANLHRMVCSEWDMAYSDDGTDAYVVMAFETPAGSLGVALNPFQLAAIIARFEAWLTDPQRTVI